MTTHPISRRQFIRLSLLSSSAAVLAACGARPVEEAAAPAGAASAGEAVAAANAAATVLVGDVVGFTLASDEWPGRFGSVTFRLQQGTYRGEPIYYIRTDSSDLAFAEQNGLVHVPLLATAAGRGIAGSLYTFGGDRLPVLSSAPSDENYISLFQIKEVSGADSAADLSSAEAIEQAARDGNLTIAEQPVYVNYPVVKWPGGELAADTARDSYLGTGQLLGPVDVANRRVTFKLHECYPGSRYIVTDTSAAPMAPMMSIAAAPPSQGMVDAGGTDEIWVFANGVAGSGVMGFQPAIFDNRAGDAAWSPFWNHFTLKWKDDGAARVLSSSAEAREALDKGEVELFNGTPDSHPNGFVVNCPVPVLAENTFQA